MKTEYYFIIAAATAGLYFAYKTTGTVKAAANAVNPLNNNNVINKGANAALGFDNKTESLGTWIYDKLHPAEVKRGY